MKNLPAIFPLSLRRRPSGSAIFPILLIAISCAWTPCRSEPLALQLAFPEPLKIETDLPAYRFGGHTDPAAKVTLDGQPLRVYPTGAFVGLLKLKAGKNVFTFVARRGSEEKSLQLSIQRIMPEPEIPKGERRFASTTTFEPKDEIWAQAGDRIRVRCMAGAELPVVYQIGEKGTPNPLQEIRRGIYEGEFEILPGDVFDKAAIVFSFKDDKDGKVSAGASAGKASAHGKITTLNNRVSLVGIVKDNVTPMYTDASSPARLANAPKDAFLRLTGLRESRWRVALSPSRSGWIRKEMIEVLPAGQRAPKLTMGSAEIMPLGEIVVGAQIISSSPAPIPFMSHINPNQRELSVQFFGVEDGMRWLRSKTGETYIDYIRRDSLEDGVLDCAVVTREPLWGYMIGWENNMMKVRVRPRPKRLGSEARPLEGLIICVDPGHGGGSFGTTGAMGIREKVFNLANAKALEKRLTAQGANVMMTRDSDRDVSLEDRIALAERENVDMFISLHCDGVGESVDPLQGRGGSVHYYHPLSAALAGRVAARLGAALKENSIPMFGLVSNNLFVARESTWFPAILVECSFLTHPEDEAILISEKETTHLMDSITQGIIDAVK
ncbi:MAG: N-acetylmuramoyl-L-alanine amidase [Candidatus Sumerlaeota bacterium]|nr:N-acetylmuramoyl-L-alanine amidase [Candidatus Sumerlaeota bacterium]